MKIKDRDVFIHANIDNLKYIDAAKLMHVLRKHIDWSKPGMLILYKSKASLNVSIDIASEHIDIYF